MRSIADPDDQGSPDERRWGRMTNTPQQAAPAPTSGAEWSQPRYLVRQRMMSIGSRYELFLPSPESAQADKPDEGPLVAFVQRKRITIKERITFRDAQEQELFSIVAPKVMNLRMRYELRAADGTVFGHLKKNVGLSFWRTSWRVLDATGEQELAVAREASGLHSFARRIAGLLPFGFVVEMIPYNFAITAGAHAPGAGSTLGSYRRRYGLRDRYDLDLRSDAVGTLDRRAALALAIALDVLQSR